MTFLPLANHMPALGVALWLGLSAALVSVLLYLEKRIRKNVKSHRR